MEVNITDIRNKLFKKLEGTGWQEVLRFFVNSIEMEDILLSLYTERTENRRFSPPLDDIFKPFQLCHYNQTNVVLIKDQPWADPSLDDGLALSHKEILRTVPEFQNVIADLTKTVGSHSVETGDLTSWAVQGMLMINLSLTEQIQRTGKHADIWRPFTTYLLEKLNQKDDLVFVFIEPFDEYFWNMVDNQSCEKIQLNALISKKYGHWNSKNVFNVINDILVNKNKNKIIW